MERDYLVQVIFEDVIYDKENNRRLYYYECVQNSISEDSIKKVINNLYIYDNSLSIANVNVSAFSQDYYLYGIKDGWYIEFSIGDKVILSKLEYEVVMEYFNEFIIGSNLKLKEVNSKVVC